MLNIDDFLSDPAAGAKVMERIGLPPDSAIPAQEAVAQALWRPPVGPAWRLYHLG